MSRITGASANTPKHLLLDAGCFFKGYDLTKTYAQNIAAGTMLGATDGGGTFSAVPVVHNVAVDGVPTNTKGLHRIDEWTITMTARMKEITAANIAIAIGACTTSTVASGSTTEAGVVGSTKIVANGDIDIDDYLTNLTWVGRLSGSDDPVIIVMKNAFSLNGFSINPADKAEAVGEYTLTGCYDLADLDDVPFAIYYPTVP